MTEKPKYESVKVKSEVADRLRLLSDLSGLSIGKIIEDFSKIADFIGEADKIYLYFIPKAEQSMLMVIMSKMACGSFLVSSETTDSEVDKRIRKESFQKLGIPED